MKKLLTVATVLLPLAAVAQYEPVAPAENPSPAYESRRSPWYIGFGIGTGDGNLSGQGTSMSFKSWHGGTSSPTNLFLNFKIGATLSPTLLVGFDGSAMRSELDQGGIVTALQISQYDAVVTWFPQGEGLFLRGGAGISRMTLSADAGIYGSVSMDTSGVNALAGVGYALWLGQAFNLTANLDYSIQSYGSSSNKPESSNFWALWVGFDWY